MKQKKTKRKRWCRLRHRLIQALVRPPFRLYCRIKYGFTARPFRDKRQVLAIMNHQTAFDQFFVSLVLRRPVYFLASEDLFSMGLLSRLLSFAVAPIPIRKSATDVRAVMTSKRVAAEGGTIAVFPEGNRTYSGRTGYIKESIAPFIRALGLPVAIIRCEGGYGVQPRWSDGCRRGRMTAGVFRVLEPEEYKALSDEELFALISRELYVDEGCPSGEFKSDRLAEHLERAIYYCPFCGMARHESCGNVITCTACHHTVEYLPTKELSGLDRPHPYRFVSEWSDAQSAAIRALDLAPYRDTPLFCDTVDTYDCEVGKKKCKTAEGTDLLAYADRFSVGGESLAFSDITGVSVLGRNKLNIYLGARVLQLAGDASLNVLKYMNLYYSVREREGKEDAGFLGI